MSAALDHLEVKNFRPTVEVEFCANRTLGHLFSMLSLITEDARNRVLIERLGIGYRCRIVAYPPGSGEFRLEVLANDPGTALQRLEKRVIESKSEGGIDHRPRAA